MQSRRTAARRTTVRAVATIATLALAGCGVAVVPESGRGGATSGADDRARSAAAAAKTPLSTPDVTAQAVAASSDIAKVWTTVTGWNAACAATSKVETYLAAAQRALSHDRLRGAQALVAMAAVSMQQSERHHLVPAKESAWFTEQARGLIRGIPSSGQVTATASFPMPPKVLRCAGATPDSSPTAPKPMFMMATGSDLLGFLNVPSTEEGVHTAVTIGIGSLPTIIGFLAPETEVPEAALAIVEGLTELLWPKSEPEPNVTWEDMTTYVGNEIDKAVTTIDKALDAQQIATMDDDLTALHTAIDRYTLDVNNLTKSPTSYAGVADVDRARAYADWLTLDNQFTTMLPHFTNDPTSYKNLPETINLYTLYMLTLRGWVLSPEVFNNNAAQTATWKAEREAELQKAIASATAVVKAQLPQLEATQPTGLGSPLEMNWNRHWKVMDAMYAAGYDQVYNWQYMDPEAYVPDPTTGRVNVPLDTTVVSTPCYGAYEVPAPAGSANASAGLYVNGDPSSILEAWRTDPTGAAGGPLRGVGMYGWPAYSAGSASDGVDGIGQFYLAWDKWRAMGNSSISTATSAPPAGVDVGPLGDSTWVTRVNGVYTAEEVDLAPGDQSTPNGPNTQLLYGGFVHVSLTTTGPWKTNADGTVTTTGTSTSTPMTPPTNGAGGDTFDVSIPGWVLAGTAFLPAAGGLVPDNVNANGKQDSCLAFAFRLQDSY